MTDIKSENKAFFWASVFLQSLQQAGVSHAVISPGSRSTPLTLAAATLPEIKTHVVLDERSAAFFALGIGKATKQPAALICTSGTAVANYFPAVIESRMSGVPLLCLTSDRPAHLRSTGANQAIDQLNIFGSYPVFFHDVGEPVMKRDDLNRLSTLAAEAVFYATDQQGPVHINFPFSKPLEPEPSFLDSSRKNRKEFIADSTGVFQQEQKPAFQFDDDTLHKLQSSDQPLIIAGQLAAKSSLKAIFSLAHTLNAPVLSEQGVEDPGYTIQGFEGFLRNENHRNQLEPDFILRFGRQPASKSLLQAIERWQPHHHIYLADSFQQVDVKDTTTHFTEWNGKPFNTDDITLKKKDWLQKWKRTERTYFKQSEQFLEKSTVLTDGHVYHYLVPQIPDGWFICISNSFPARDHSMFGQWSTQKTFTNRGASGIDGITSTAMGINAGLDQPGILFTGDLAFLHDTNALLNAQKLKQPLVVVVINNNGGSIFRMLPIADHSDYFLPYFETPQKADITALSKSYGVITKLIGDLDALKEIDLLNLVSEAGSKLTILECQTDPDASMRLRKKIWDKT